MRFIKNSGMNVIQAYATERFEFEKQMFYIRSSDGPIVYCASNSQHLQLKGSRK